ncbi:MAG: hypothetical protein K6A64_04925, partial [Bacteroidales bacterium]|nr:hypothetical protein [Bacteroidales bacterium]
MDTLGSIIEGIRDYMNRCVKCSKCRQGACPLAGAVGYLTSMRILVAPLRASGTAVSRCVAPTGSFPKLAVG